MILRHRDKDVLRFNWLEPEGVFLVSVMEENRSLLPIGIREYADDPRMLERRLEAWLKGRTAPMGRHFFRNVLEAVGLDPLDPGFHRKALSLSLGLSLNDVYWVVEDDASVRWSETNLYRNEFSRTLAEIAFAGVGSKPTDAVSTSPELTTNGMLPKCWRRIDGEILLYKGASETFANEPYAEYYAAQIAEAMGLETVAYDLAMFKRRLCSTCRLFTGERFGYVPASRFPDRAKVVADRRFAKMFLFDAIVLNTDRHLGNFGYLVDNETNEILGPAPVFDNGYALFDKGVRRHTALFARWLDFPGGLDDELRATLARLRGFRFKRHHHYNWPTERLAEIEHFLQKRIDDILQYGEEADDYLAITENRVGINTKNSVGDAPDGIPELDALSLQLLWNIQANPLVTVPELAEILGRDQRTIERHLADLKAKGLLVREGSNKKGSWKVLV